ncbi:M23 family metallopeptidase (plasmid) [Deinococcus taeanensis]|uniref:M23 family metallopeptidase n=1 Tax=Deinococcus taeanensis TaxID=2737050 RepID=UPI001CDBF5C5|nr:M23 family metallopeptidase [Deinococcus taeanensis]UBV45335.1 M23 family metallopeptidase [Deinococcus taeanensis]
MSVLSLLTAPLTIWAVLALTPGVPAKDRSALCPPEPRESPAREAQWNRALNHLTVLGRSLPAAPDAQLWMPVDGVHVRDVADTWGAVREGARHHAGQDVFAPPGTFVRSSTTGVVWRIGSSVNGGQWVYVLGAGGRRYYYAHLGRVNRALREGQAVTSRTILGTVGNSGNAGATPAHLHFSVFTAYRPGEGCRFLAINPLPLLRDR